MFVGEPAAALYCDKLMVHACKARDKKARRSYDPCQDLEPVLGSQQMTMMILQASLTPPLAFTTAEQMAIARGEELHQGSSPAHQRQTDASVEGKQQPEQTHNQQTLRYASLHAVQKPVETEVDILF